MSERHFTVHGSGEPPARTRHITGVSFEDAALAYVEEWRPAPDDGDEVSVIVEDARTGERQCFRIDLGTGAAAPCA
jgi:hypothetical protein